MANTYAVLEFSNGVRVKLTEAGWESPAEGLGKLFNRLFPFRAEEYGPADGHPLIAHARGAAAQAGAELVEMQYPEEEPGLIY